MLWELYDVAKSYTHERKKMLRENTYNNELWNRIPAHMQESLRAYIEEARPVGHFLAAVLNNNLKEAVNRADEENLRAIPDYIKWLYNYAPSACWGYDDATMRWSFLVKREKEEKNA